jgi:hypothetical protein
MNFSKYSIWKGSGAFVWALALAMLIFTEAIYIFIHISLLHKWSSSSSVLVAMLTLPFSIGVNIYRKLVRNVLELKDDLLIQSCSFRFACVVLTAYALAFNIIIDSLLNYYRISPK